jgi:hypothetical protein
MLLNNKATDWFAVKSGVKQGCIISPILFLVAIDWVMKKTISDKKRGITWSMFTTSKICIPKITTHLEVQTIQPEDKNKAV